MSSIGTASYYLTDNDVLFSTVHLLSMVTPWHLNFRIYYAGKWCMKLWDIYEKDLWKFYVWVWATKQISTEISFCLSYGSILAQSLFVLWLNPGSVLICPMTQSWLSPYLFCGSILAQTLFFVWLNPYFSHGSILAQSLFALWLNPGSIIICPVAHSWPGRQDWAIGKIRTEPGWAARQIRAEPGLSHRTNKEWARIEPYDK